MFERQLTHFIEEKRSTVGKFESPNASVQGSRERPLHTSEQLAFNQPSRDGGTVEFTSADSFDDLLGG